jgi:hypothetical protein
VVRYSRNGTVFYSSTRTPVYPLLVDCALLSQNATLNSAVIWGATALPEPEPEPEPEPAGEAVAWTSAVGVAVNGNSLTKTAASGWGNAGAVSSQAIASGDGYVEFTASETTTYRMLGLSNGDTSQSYTDIDFAMYENGSRLEVYEAGAYKGYFGNYTAGDRLRVAVSGGVVRYSRNGTVFYSSTRTPVYPLLVDCALLSQNATLNSAVIALP